MVTVDCPFCEGPLDGEALLEDGELRCDGCSITVELALDQITIPVAAAA
jgi:hypothetical protein